VLVASFPAAAFATNCYVVAPEAGGPCLIVDPGVGVVDQLAELLAKHQLEPQAVLLTHGHADHTWSVTPVCDASGIPALIHTDDEYRLRDPLSDLGAGIVQMLEQQYGQSAKWTEPSDARTFADHDSLTFAGLTLTVEHAPGHTEGSVLFRLPQSDGPELCFSGDVLFAGSIGRTDLPGGDHTAMQRSLAERILPLADETVVLPGHGPATTIGRERASNPFLTGLVEGHIGG
jgi:glyoxylase-like metal-dependent hydrolase (beta-lactamase superfamily II)